MKRAFFLLLSSLSFIWAEEIPVYRDIPDLLHPTIADLQTIQTYLLTAERPELKLLWDKEFLPREFKFIGETPDEWPQSQFVAVNSWEGERENCVITYASFNHRYPEGAKRLVAKIKESDFRGDIHCRIGGWPDIEGGSLILAHVPFAFKACFFKEVQRMGYKRALWLDASIIPVASLNRIFEMIRKKGYFIQRNTHDLDEFFLNETTAAAFGLPLAEAQKIHSCSGAIIGVDFTNPRSAALIDAWYEAAKDPWAFYSPRSDQTALSILLHQMGMTDLEPPSILGSAVLDKDPRNLFVMHREFVK